MRERSVRGADRESRLRQTGRDFGRDPEPLVGKSTRVDELRDELGDEAAPPVRESEVAQLGEETLRLRAAIERGDFAAATVAAATLRGRLARASARVEGAQPELRDRLAERAREAELQLERAPRLDRETLHEAVVGAEREQWTHSERAWRARIGLPPASDPLAIAERGVEEPGGALPFRSEIQASFGRHDVSQIHAVIGGRAIEAGQRLGARAYAYGDRVAFAGAPDLHTAAHEAAHVVQQRAGVALAGGIGSAGDPHEAQADEVADLVVANRSAEHVLDRIAGTGRSATPAMPVVQRKEDAPPVKRRKEDTPLAPVVSRKDDAAQPPVGDRKYTVRHTFEWPLPVPRELGEVRFQVRWEISVSRAGAGHTKAGPVKVDVGSVQAIQDFKTASNAAATRASRKISDTLVKLGGTLLGGDHDLALLGVPVSLKLEAKFLEAELSLDQLKLNAMKAALVGEADFGGLPGFRELGEQVAAKGQLRLELVIPADIVHDLYRAAQATRSLKRAAEVETRLGEANRRLANRKKRIAKLAMRGRLAGPEAARLKGLLGEVDELERTVGKLQRLRAGAIRGRAKALHTLATVGKSLAKTPMGRVLTKAASKALSLTLKRFLPIYNFVATAQDVYALAEFLVRADWSKLGDGKAGFGDAGGDGREGMGGGDAPDHEDPLGTADLEEPGTVELTSAAEEVVAPLVATSGEHAQPLDDDAKEIINACVPNDLSPDELAEIGKLLGSPAPSDPTQPVAQSVIAAVQKVRPDGAPRAKATPAADPAHPTGAPTTPTQAHSVPADARPAGSSAPTQAQPRPPNARPAGPSQAQPRAPERTPAQQAPRATEVRPARPHEPSGDTKKPGTTRVVDVHGYLVENVGFNPVTRQVEIAQVLVVDGVTFRVVETKHGLNFATDRETILVELEVLAIASPSLELPSGTRLAVGVRLTEVFEAEPRLVVSPAH